MYSTDQIDCRTSEWSSVMPAIPTTRSGARPTRRSSELEVGEAPINSLLAALPGYEWGRLRPMLERVLLRRRQVLHERNVPISHAYFLEKGTVSMLARATGHDSVEVGSLGRDDVVGISVVLGASQTPHRCIVQVPGEALRIRTADLWRTMRASPTLHTLLLTYVQAALVRSTQLVVCNAHHNLQERLARLLLLTHEQLEGDDIPLTHRTLSRALGVRRAGVTTAVGGMEAAGILRRGRGRLTILDRSGLEQVACECHRVIRTERRRLICEAVPDARQ